MVTGRLITLKEHYYAVLNLKHEDGSRWQKRINLNMPVQNNKRRAEEKLLGLRMEYTRLQDILHNSTNMLFPDVLNKFLHNKKEALSPTTYKNYRHMVEKYINPYFTGKQAKSIFYSEIEAYYEFLSDKGLSNTTIQHHHMILKQAFHTAHRRGIIDNDPMELVKKPKRQIPNTSYYSLEEAQSLWEAVSGHKLELVVKLTLFYGFRRSEVVGLRWSDINFQTGTISVNQSVVNAFHEGKLVVRDKSELKGKSSRRTMPISDIINELLIREYEAKKRFCSKYVCTDSKGQLIKPDEVTNAFGGLLKKNGLRHIRFHDLRHPYVKHRQTKISNIFAYSHAGNTLSLSAVSSAKFRIFHAISTRLSG